MTCIATDGKTMAADSRSCRADLIATDSAAKLAHGKDGSVIGCAGERGACALVREWFESGADLEKIPKLPASADGESPFNALILRPGGKVETLDYHFVFMSGEAPAAIGTGGEIALGALLSKKTPKEAVALAATKVVSVGGEVVELRPRA